MDQYCEWEPSAAVYTIVSLPGVHHDNIFTVIFIVITIFLKLCV